MSDRLSVRIEGHEGDLIDAYFARPLTGGPYPSVVVVHHMHERLLRHPRTPRRPPAG